MTKSIESQLLNAESMNEEVMAYYAYGAENGESTDPIDEKSLLSLSGLKKELRNHRSPLDETDIASIENFS